MTRLTIPRDTFIPAEPDSYERLAAAGSPVSRLLGLQAKAAFARNDDAECWLCLFQSEFYRPGTTETDRHEDDTDSWW